MKKAVVVLVIALGACSPAGEVSSDGYVSEDAQLLCEAYERLEPARVSDGSVPAVSTLPAMSYAEEVAVDGFADAYRGLRTAARAGTARAWNDAASEMAAACDQARA